jgi:hypothetical protein
MNNHHIEYYLENDPNFLGCFPHDSLDDFKVTPNWCNNKKRKTKSIIINTDSGRGEHWVAMVLTGGKCFYFDSFGLPIINTNILNYVNTKKYKTVTYSNQCIQDYLSTSCGLFCIAFVMYVKNRKDYLSFLSIFKEDLRCNDSVVKNLLK